MVSHTASGIARAAKRVRDLLAHYTNDRDMNEGAVGFLLFGFLVATLGAARVRREYDVDTIATNGKRGRPEQIDFVIGRTRRVDGKFSPDTVVEFALRRESHRAGADPIGNLSEIKKLVRAESCHRVLLLVDLTADDHAAAILKKYRERGYAQGRPRGAAKDRVSVVYVGEHGTKHVRLKRQNLKPKRRRTNRETMT
jgi:hypothetical protein